MITILDFVNAGGKCVTAAGWKFEICYIEKESNYPICGYVVNPTGIKQLYKWNEEGFPENLPLTHGLNLIPTVPITTHHIIDVKQLKEFDKVQDLVRSEIMRIETD